MANKKPLILKKVVEYDWEKWNLDGVDEFIRPSSWGGVFSNIFKLLVVSVDSIVMSLVYILITFFFAPIDYFLTRKVYYEEIK